MPAVEKPSHLGALSYRSFTGRWPWLPDFTTMTPEKTGEVAGFILPTDDSKGDAKEVKESGAGRNGPQVGIAFEGLINVPADGQYTFSVTSDSGVALWLHDSLIVDDDFTHDDAPRAGTARLQAGWHPIRLFYRHDPATFAPRLAVALHGPGVDVESLKPESLGYNEFTKPSRLR
jgi:hypothetical protein